MRRSPSASTTSVTIWSTTSSSVRPVVSTGTRVAARLEHVRSAVGVALVALVLVAQRPASTSPPLSAARRRARSSGSAVRKTLTAASGATTVPMSRPSATQSPSATIACWLAHERGAHARVGRRRARRASVTSGVRIASVTSRPSSRTRSPTSMSSRAATSAGGSPARAASATQRYIAPVSRYVKPSRSATARATVDLPAPAGPSMAMTMRRQRDERRGPRGAPQAGPTSCACKPRRSTRPVRGGTLVSLLEAHGRLGPRRSWGGGGPAARARARMVVDSAS